MRGARPRRRFLSKRIVCDSSNVDPTAALPAANALIAGLTLLLNQLHRKRDSRAPQEREDMRAALLQLESYIAEWTAQAEETNAIARAWAGFPPEQAGSAKELLLDSVVGQQMWVASGEFGLVEGLIAPGFSREKSQMTLEGVLRVYAPEFYDSLVVFSRRREQLDAMIAELERRRSEGGMHSTSIWRSSIKRQSGLKRRAVCSPNSSQASSRSANPDPPFEIHPAAPRRSSC